MKKSFKNHNSLSIIHNSGRGFTILELLLVMASIAIIAGFSIPLWRNQLIKNDLDVAVMTISQTLKRAQILAQAVDGDIGWGVKVQSGNITLFKGNTYAARDTNFDETFTLQSAIVPSGLSEVDYTKFTGLPGTTGTIILTTEQDNKSITINAKGMISY